MRGRVVVSAVLALLAGSTSFAAELCSGPNSQAYRDCVRMVDSLRPDKAGQARVYATDGSEFTAGQALWMRGQMRRVERLCATGRPGDQAEAARVLAGVQALLSSHRSRS